MPFFPSPSDLFLLHDCDIEQHYVAQGLSIVGYFHTNKRFGKVELSGVANNIGDHISLYFPHAPIP
ncbi:unnamed protein product [Brassica rapa]|uniref:Uncharacterized protein n=1 Tax=Brassica campestris TaxID=3711 RepID=A0A8D9GYE5_BRACM|nr:unnamed protein product [Brassica rapa]CAG7897378.1 unnamed protein product [Brassica rapa]